MHERKEAVLLYPFSRSQPPSLKPGPGGCAFRNPLFHLVVAPGGAMKGVQEEVGWSGALMCRQAGGESCGATVFSGS